MRLDLSVQSDLVSGLAPYVPPSLRQRLGAGPIGNPPVHAHADAALLLSDISGFTALTEKLQSRGHEGAEEMTELVRTAFVPAIRSIESHGGSVIAFGGDALFVTFEGPGAVRRAIDSAEAGPRPVRGQSKGADLGGPSHPPDRPSRPLRPDPHPPPGPRRPKTLHRRTAHRSAPWPDFRPGPAPTRSRSLPKPGPGSSKRGPAEGGLARVDDDRLRPYVAPHVLTAHFAGFRGEFRRVVMAFIETRGGRWQALQRFTIRLIEVLEECGGTLIGIDVSPEGLKWLCAFGAPVAHEDDPHRASHALTSIMRLHSPSLSLRAGAHQGTAAVIWMGGPTRCSLEVMGDVTNTAARIQAQAGWGEALIPKEIRDLLPDHTVRSRGIVQVKGKRRRLELFELLGASRSETRVRAHAPMVGRDVELARLEESWHCARSGAGRVMGIQGEAGIGKSRMRHELTAVVERSSAEVFGCRTRFRSGRLREKRSGGSSGR